jgi:Holliday junction DNA helicase RuvB
MLTSPLRDRFGINFRLDYYDNETLKGIIERSSSILGVKIKSDAALEIAGRSRGTPRIANRLLKRTRDFADHLDKDTIDMEVAQIALTALDVDKYGLDEMDKDIILSIIEKYGGGPVGLTTIAVAVGEEKDTIEEVYEPFLIQRGFLQRTPRGRIATEFAYKHFNKPLGRDLVSLFDEAT